jgi:hypothetical protein
MVLTLAFSFCTFKCTKCESVALSRAYACVCKTSLLANLSKPDSRFYVSQKRAFLTLSKSASRTIIFIDVQSFKTRPVIKVSKGCNKLAFETLQKVRAELMKLSITHSEAIK